MAIRAEAAASPPRGVLKRLIFQGNTWHDIFVRRLAELFPIFASFFFILFSPPFLFFLVSLSTNIGLLSCFGFFLASVFSFRYRASFEYEEWYRETVVVNVQ